MNQLWRKRNNYQSGYRNQGRRRLPRNGTVGYNLGGKKFYVKIVNYRVTQRLLISTSYNGYERVSFARTIKYSNIPSGWWSVKSWSYSRKVQTAKSQLQYKRRNRKRRYY